jgi:aryl-alcohol dehydrogenase-like predicted oxidoreductase
MEKRNIGSLTVSAVGLGCNNFGGRLDVAGTRRVVDAALDIGIDFFDTADIYGGTKSEEFLGEVLAGRRDRVILATKFGIKVDDARPGGASPEYIRRAVDDSLSRLKTDRIELYQQHRPDDSVPIAETLGALDALVKAGKVREIGCSNFSVDQLRAAEAASREHGYARFVSVQNQYSLFHREAERDGVIEECTRTGEAFLPFFPLASGLLTGKYRKGQAHPEGTRIGADSKALTDENLDRVEALVAFAAARGHTILDVAISWLLARPAIASVIAGATKPEQVNDNVVAAGMHLSAADLAEIDRILG